MGKISTAVRACSPIRAQQRGWLRSQTKGRDMGRDMVRKSSTTSLRETSGDSLPLRPHHHHLIVFVCVPQLPCPVLEAGRACSAHAAPWG